MIKLIVSDVDGTLVPEGTNDIHPEIFKSDILSVLSTGFRFELTSVEKSSLMICIFSF